MSFTNAQLAQKVSDLIGYWTDFAEEYANWLGGTASGGPGADGRYTLTDWNGNESLVKSPARLQQDVDGQVNSAEAHKDAAATSETNAAASASTATTQAGLADTARQAAEAAQTAAELAETGAVDAKVTAVAQANNASSSASAAATSEANAATSEQNAADSEAAAAASAAAAATFDPVLYAALADDETINGSWTFTSVLTHDRDLYNAINRWSNTTDTNTVQASWRSMSAAGSGWAFVPEPLGAIDPSMMFGFDFNDNRWRFEDDLLVLGTTTVGNNHNNGAVLMVLNAERSWEFRAEASGASTRLALWSTSNKILDIGGDTNGLSARFNTGSGETTLLGDLLFSTGVAVRGDDAWLRLNPDSAFTNGVYTPGNMRVQQTIELGSANITLDKGMDDILKVATASGYIEIGPRNASYCHIQTDLSQFYFSKDIVLNGVLKPYGNQDIELTAGQNCATALAVRANNNPANPEAIFSVESSGSATRFGVTQGNGAWARDGFYIGTADDGDLSTATLVEVLHHVSTGYVGGKITVGTTAPSSPTKGDIWIDTS